VESITSAEYRVSGASSFGNQPTLRSDPVRLHQLDGLRGVAMLFVFFSHFSLLWLYIVQPNSTIGFFLRLVDADAAMGTNFFMLLSGFFSYGTLLKRKKSFGSFLRGRAARLYPLYLVMSAGYIAGSLLIPHMSKLPANPADAAVFLLQTLLFMPGVLHIRPLMDVAWTMSFIVMFYFIEGAITWVFRKLAISRRTRFTILVILAAAWAFTGDMTGWWAPRTDIFWVGMALWEAVDGMRAPHRLRWVVETVPPALLVTLIGMGLRTELMMARPDTHGISVLLLRAFITSCTLFAFVWVAHFGPVWWKRLLSGKLLRSLGECSYSFYLSHGFTVKAFHFLVIPALGASAKNPLVFWLCQGVGLVASVVCARIVFRTMEQPMSMALAGMKFPAGSFAWLRSDASVRFEENSLRHQSVGSRSIQIQ